MKAVSYGRVWCQLGCWLAMMAVLHGEGDISALVEKAAEEGRRRVVVPAGVYRVAETIRVANVKNMEVRGEGVTLIKTTPGEVLRISDSGNVKISGFTFDYDPLPFTQGTVTGVSGDGLRVEFEIHAGYRRLTKEMLETSARHYFDGRTREWKEGANIFARPRIEMLKGRKGRATFETAQEGVARGDFVVFDRRSVDRGACVGIVGCEGVVELADVTIRAAGSLGVMGRYCEKQVVLRRVKIERGPRPEGALEERLLSTNADGVNFAYCREGPLLEGCDFSFMGDDSLNVHGMALPVIRVESGRSVLVSRGKGLEEFPGMLREGEVVDVLMGKTFQRIGRVESARVTVLRTSMGISAREVGQYFENYKGSQEAPAVMRVEFREEVRFLKTGQWLEFPGLNSPGYVVRGSVFRDHRARGLRLMGSHGVVEGNRFERIGGAAIQIGPEWRYWREAGWVRDVIVRNNEFRDVGMAGDFGREWCYTPGVISIVARTDALKAPRVQEQENIVIEGNTISGSPGSGIYAYGVRGLIIRGNVIERTNLKDGTRMGRQAESPSRRVIDLKGVSDAVVEQNVVKDQR